MRRESNEEVRAFMPRVTEGSSVIRLDSKGRHVGLRGVVATILLLVAASAPPAFAEMITADGVAAVTGNVANAREKAIDDALRRAVEQTVGTLISSETMTNNF